MEFTLWGVQIAGMVVMLAIAPMCVGIAQTVKARMQGRHGPTIWQGYWVLRKLWSKETTIPEHSSWVFRLAPPVSLSALVVIAALIPWGGQVPRSWPHDLLTVFFLMSLERFWVGLAGLDTAGTFGGLGSSRIMTLGSGIEPATFSVFGILWLLSGSTNLAPIASRLMHHRLGAMLWVLVAIGYLCVLLAEVGRLPVDNPDTHLELTMMHEATLLEYNGRLLAEAQAAIGVKFAVIIGIGCVWLGPQLPSPWANLVLRIVELVGVSAFVGFVESQFVKLRYFRLPAYMSVAFGTGLLAVFVAATGGWM